MSRQVRVLSAMVLGVGLVAAWVSQQWAGERERSAALRARITELEAQLAEAAEELERPGSVAAHDPAPVVSATHDTGETSEQDWPPSGRLSDREIAAYRALQEQERVLYEDPEFREASLKQMTALFRGRLAALRSELGLPLEEFEQIVEMLAQVELQQRIRAKDAMIAGTPETHEMFDEESWRWRAERGRAVDLALRDALGDTRYREWVEYQHSLPAREQLEELQGALEFSGAPLTSEQQQELLPILREAQKRTDARLAALGIAPTGRRVSTDMDQSLRQEEATIEVRAEVNRSTAAAVAEILTPAQQEAFVTYLERELDLQRAQLLTEQRTLEAFRRR